VVQSRQKIAEGVLTSFKTNAVVASLQPFMHRSFFMMFFLILNIFDNPFQVFGTKGYYRYRRSSTSPLIKGRLFFVCQVMWKLISEYTLCDIAGQDNRKDVKTPFDRLANLDHGLKAVAICPSGNTFFVR